MSAAAANEPTTETVVETRAITPYDFEGSRLDVVPLQDGDVGVCLRRLCEAVPVDPDSQAKRLRRAAKKGARWATTVVLTVVAEDGKRREMLVLPRRSIPFWAATISLNHVREALRPGATKKLVGFHDTCADRLADAFLGPRCPAGVPAALDRVLEEQQMTSARLGQVERILAALVAGAPSRSFASHLRARVNEIAVLRVTAGLSRSLASSTQTIIEELKRAVNWGGPGKPWESLDPSRHPLADEALDVIEKGVRDLAKVKNAPAQGDLFGDHAKDDEPSDEKDGLH